MKKVLLAVTIGGLLASATVQAKEGGDQYPNGAENWLVGAVPPPGNYFINYLGSYSGTLRDGNGNKIQPGGNDIKVNATFDALRYVGVTDKVLFGGNYAWAAILPIVNLSIDVAGTAAGKTGIGDATITPIILSWHSPELHTAVAMDVNLPTGSFNKNNAPGQNIGANYYSIEPVYAVTYLRNDGWEVSSKFMYNWKTKNNATDYQSGDEFHMDYLVGKHIDSWAVGVSGYYLKQVSDDTMNGVKVGPDGNRGQVFAIGPSVKYETASHSHLIFQWQHESMVQNRFEGDKLWFKFITAM